MYRNKYKSTCLFLLLICCCYVQLPVSSEAESCAANQYRAKAHAQSQICVLKNIVLHVMSWILHIETSKVRKIVSVTKAPLKKILIIIKILVARWTFLSSSRPDSPAWLVWGWSQRLDFGSSWGPALVPWPDSQHSSVFVPVSPHRNSQVHSITEDIVPGSWTCARIYTV